MPESAPTRTFLRRRLAAVIVVAATLVAVIGARPSGAAAPAVVVPSGPFNLACPVPSTGLSDAAATPQARCVYAAIQRAGSGGNLPIGQQLNTATFTRREPIATLTAERYGDRAAATPAVVGSDMGAFIHYLQKPAGQGEPAVRDHVAALVADARAGRLVTLSWHAQSPFTGGGFRDRRNVDLPALLDAATPAGQAWANQTALAIDVLRRFDAAGVPVAFRPFHEANLRAFWWGQPDPAVFRALWDQLRSRVETAGLHNVIWVYAANYRWGTAVMDPLSLVPARYDVFGIDAYDVEANQPDDRIPLQLSDYRRIVELGKPFAFTEVGPLDSSDGAWDPATVTRAVSERYPRAAWALFWATYSPNARMAIPDLVGHQAWWSGCLDGTCPTTRPAVATPAVAVAPVAKCEGVSGPAFTDVGGAEVHAGAIGCAAGLDLASGTTPSTFDPAGTVSRAQMASFVGRVVAGAGVELAGRSSFGDVAPTDPHAASIGGLAALGVLSGFEDGLFRPTAPVTRAQAAAYVARAYRAVTGRDLPAAGAPAFTDVSGPLAGDVSRATAAGILRGTSATTFSPLAGTSRAQMATVLVRLAQHLADA